MGNELLNFQRLALSWVAQQRDSFLRAMGDAHPTAHACRIIDVGKSVIHRNRRKLTILGAGAATSA